MADPEHLKILVQGVDAWNKWRREQPHIRPDLRNADLYGEYVNEVYRSIESSMLLRFGSDRDDADLNAVEEEADRELEQVRDELFDETGWPRTGADFSGVDFSGTNLWRSDLFRADLSGANLTEAELGGARLNEANLRNAKLARTNLDRADLSEATLTGADLSGAKLAKVDLEAADLCGADLTEADLRGARLNRAKLSGAKLPRTRLDKADLTEATLSGADLSGAKLAKVDLEAADLSGTNLADADLKGAALIRTDLTDANLAGCYIYGISAWGVKLSSSTKQHGLVITDDIKVDDIEVAQFLYVLLSNEKLQRVIDTITSKVVLILGRFSIIERKRVLDALREELRKRGYVPVIFDFEKPRSQTTINTVTLLARMARFVIADVSDAKSVLQELEAIVKSSPKLPVQSIIVATQEEPGMFDSFEAYPWFLKVHRYEASKKLIDGLEEYVIGPAEATAAKLRA